MYSNAHRFSCTKEIQCDVLCLSSWNTEPVVDLHVVADSAHRILPTPGLKGFAASPDEVARKLQDSAVRRVSNAVGAAHIILP